jgi:SRSO17 transposase
MESFLTSYRRHEQSSHATTFVRGLCSDLEHKNGESIAYMFGLERKTIQHFIGESKWADEPLRAELARQIGNDLGEADGVLAFDPSAFPKAGKQSVGVNRQWCGRLGKTENCQVGVYLSYVSSIGHALVDTELYLPKDWTSDKQRMKRAGIPKDQQRFRTRHQICLDLLDRHGDVLPHTWITGDDELGRPAGFRRELRERNERYLLAVPSNTKIRDLGVSESDTTGNSPSKVQLSQRVDSWVADRDDEEWTEVEVRDGEKGPLIVNAISRPVQTGWEKYSTVTNEVLVVIRYHDRDSRVVKTDYYLSNADSQTSVAEFCRAAKAELRVEECFRRGKSQAGMADYEVRNWTGWHHHQTLALIASWFLNVETRRAEKKDACDNHLPSPPRHRVVPSHPPRIRYATRRNMAYPTTAGP